MNPHSTHPSQDQDGLDSAFTASTAELFKPLPTIKEIKAMPDTLELLPELTVEAMPLFANEAEYFDFRELFMQEVIPEQEKWLEARLKSEA